MKSRNVSTSFSVEQGTDEGIVNPLNNEQIQVDFKPLLQCIHIYDALNSRAELQQAYQADRQVRPISYLIVSPI
jgi:hypothetical protein